MLKISEYPAEIEKVKAEIEETDNPKRKEDLRKYLRRLIAEQLEYKRLYGTKREGI